MATLPFRIDEAVISALAFNGTNFSSTSLRVMVKKNAKEDRMKRVDFINNSLISSSTQTSEKWWAITCYSWCTSDHVCSLQVLLNK